MKHFIVIIAVLIIPALSHAYDNFKKEKKVLTETIINTYDSWAVGLEQETKTNNVEAFSITEKGGKEILIQDEVVNRDINPANDHKFKDFEFTIVNNQAIVQFTVDHQLISAFLEKVAGKWKLICAAKLDSTS